MIKSAPNCETCKGLNKVYVDPLTGTYEESCKQCFYIAEKIKKNGLVKCAQAGCRNSAYYEQIDEEKVFHKYCGYHYGTVLRQAANCPTCLTSPPNKVYLNGITGEYEENCFSCLKKIKTCYICNKKSGKQLICTECFQSSIDNAPMCQCDKQKVHFDTDGYEYEACIDCLIQKIPGCKFEGCSNKVISKMFRGNQIFEIACEECSENLRNCITPGCKNKGYLGSKVEYQSDLCKRCFYNQKGQ